MRARYYRRGGWVTPGESVDSIVRAKARIMQSKSLGTTVFFLRRRGRRCPRVRPGAGAAEERLPYKGAVVRVACPDKATAALIAVSAPAWAGRCQARVETATYAPPKGPDGIDGADVWVIRPAEMPRWAAAGRLVPAPQELTSVESGSGWTGLLPLYRDRLLLWDRTAYALPVRGEAPVCFYRRDLLGDAGRRAAYEAKYGRKLGPPRTWDEFADIAEFFQGEPSGLVHSLPPLPQDDGALEREFYAVAACYARRAVLADEPAGPESRRRNVRLLLRPSNGPATDRRPRLRRSPGAVAAAAEVPAGRGVAVAGRRLPTRPGGAVPGGRLPADGVSEGRRDEGPRPLRRVPDAGGRLLLPIGRRRMRPGARRQLRPLPRFGRLAGRRAQGGAARGRRLLAAGRAERPRDERPDRHWRPLRRRSDPLGAAGRADQLVRLRVDAGGGQGAAGDAATDAAASGRQNPVLPLRTPDEAEHQAVLAAALRTALASPKDDPKKALEEVARRWEEIDRAKGAAHLAEYRISVGLLPD